MNTGESTRSFHNYHTIRVVDNGEIKEIRIAVCDPHHRTNDLLIHLFIMYARLGHHECSF